VNSRIPLEMFFYPCASFLPFSCSFTYLYRPIPCRYLWYDVLHRNARAAAKYRKHLCDSTFDTPPRVIPATRKGLAPFFTSQFGIVTSKPSLESLLWSSIFDPP